MVKAEGTLLLAGSLKLNFDPYSWVVQTDAID